jgi:CheY-like chemotaxis protein
VKILVADDEQTITIVVQKILENAGHHVVTTNEGTQVAFLIETEKPDLLIIDILMPEMDGIENIMATKANCPDLPIIAISSEPRHLNSAQCLGAHLSIPKPLRAGKLVDMVSQFIPEVYPSTPSLL